MLSATNFSIFRRSLRDKCVGYARLLKSHTYFFVALYAISALATLGYPSHILMYAPWDNLLCRLLLSQIA
ncbi:MAG TPA: hypothetical protein DEV59_09760 [Proteus sp.]|nr:hypothetical protein [Proteus sp. (in: enterobacteria)]